MSRIITAIIVSVFLTGCADRISVRTQETERVKLQLQEPNPVMFSPIRWRVITPDNINMHWKELEDSKQELVLFAITPNTYENLSVDLLETRNYILESNKIIKSYKGYYEDGRN
jgi:hypothetical protein